MERADEPMPADPGTPLDRVDTQAITEIDRVVHEPSRLLILAVLNTLESADFLFLAGQTGLTRGNLSSHLAKLEEAGYVEVRKEFVGKVPRTTLALTGSGRAAFRDYTARMAGILDSLAQ